MKKLLAGGALVLALGATAGATDHNDPVRVLNSKERVAKKVPFANGLESYRARPVPADIADVFAWHTGDKMTDHLVIVVTWAPEQLPSYGQDYSYDEDVYYKIHIKSGDVESEIHVQYAWADGQWGVRYSNVPGFEDHPIVAPTELTVERKLKGDRFFLADHEATMRLWSGLRDEPFTIDLEGLFRFQNAAGIPDPGTWATVLDGPLATPFAAPGTGGDLFNLAAFRGDLGRSSFHGTNVAAVVMEIPLFAVAEKGAFGGVGDTIQVWAQSFRLGGLPPGSMKWRAEHGGTGQGGPYGAP